MVTILCVDDDATALQALTRVLCGVASVATARSLRDACATRSPAVAAVLSAAEVAGVSGIALLAEVRRCDETIGRILLAGRAGAETWLEAVDRGDVHHWIATPWDGRELRAAVRHALAAACAERERRRLAAEVAAARLRLQELDGMKRRVLTLAAHELRTPLHVAAAALEALADLPLPSVAARALLATARRNLAWLGRGVGAMTALERLAHGTRARPRPLCVAALARRAAGEIAPLCARRRLRLVHDIPGQAPVVGDPDDLRRALMNVLLNAIRFTADGGRVAITLRRAPGIVALVVTDTGIGIPTSIRGHIGEPFFTAQPLDRHHSDPIAFQSGGIGLGLAVARAIVAEHGGRLWFESEEGRGTSVHLELPAGVPPTDAGHRDVRVATSHERRHENPGCEDGNG